MKAKFAVFAVVAGLGLVLLSNRAGWAQQVTVVNGTKIAMVALQARTPRYQTWSADLLQNRALGVGRSVQVTLPYGSSCTYGFFATFYDGHKVLKAGVNVCRTKPVVISDY